MQKALVKILLFPLHEKIVGRKTCQFLRELECLQWKTPAELQELQFRKLRELLLHARRNIPFYSRRFAAVGFNPEKMQSADDLKLLPVLTKSEIRQNLGKMVWEDCPRGGAPLQHGRIFG